VNENYERYCRATEYLDRKKDEAWEKKDIIMEELTYVGLFLAGLFIGFFIEVILY